jgi:choline-sulfatase
MRHRPRNVLFLMADQLRYDWLSCNGGAWCPTPNLDRLAAMGTRFTQCVTNSPVCLPARIGLATGLRPHRLGATDNLGHIPLWAPCYYRHFRDHGYRVVLRGKAHLDAVEAMDEDLPRAAPRPYLREVGFTDAIEYEGKVVSSWAAAPRSPYTWRLYERGLLDRYRGEYERRRQGNWVDTDAQPSPLPDEDHIDRVIADEALDWIETCAAESQPWYLFASFSGPHSPYDPPARWAKRFANDPMPPAIPFVEDRANTWLRPGGKSFGFTPAQVLAFRRNYSGLVAHIDEQVGRILDALAERGWLEDTVLVFTSDHGDDLGDYDHISKCVPMENAIRVPLIVAGGGMQAGAVSDALCELNDAQATVCELAGLPPLTGSEAISLSSCPEGRPFQVSTYRDFALIREGRRKYIEAVRGDRYLFDLESDPGETRNLAGEAPETAATLRRRLRGELS